MTDRRRYDIRDVREGLRLAARDLAEQLFPGGRFEPDGRYWPINHVRADKRAGSFVIDTRGPTAGRFVDFADDTVKGDALALICYAKGIRIAEAIQWAGRWLGLSDEGRRRAIEEARRNAPRVSDANAGVVQAALDKKARTAQAWFYNGKPLAGSIGEKYLRGRGIPLDRLGFRPGAIKFAPSLKYRGPEGERRFPGLLTAMTNASGEVRAVHRTYLDPETAKKAPVAAAKKMWGDVRRTSIRLSKGEHKCTPEEAARQGLWGETLAAGEGIEDMLNWSILFPDHRTAAYGSLANLRGLPIYPSIGTLILVRDNDANPKTREAFERAAEDLRAMHPDVEHITAEPVGAKDINELWEKCA